MAKTLTERLQDDKENILDRREISPDSRKQIAENIENENYKKALVCLFDVIVGEEVDKYPPVRNVVGSIQISDSAIESLDGRRLQLVITLGNKNRSVVLSESSSEYTFKDVEEGSYSFSASNESGVVYEYDEDGMDRIEYEIESIDISTEFESVDVDSTEVEYGEDIVGSEIVVESIEVGNEV